MRMMLVLAASATMAFGSTAHAESWMLAAGAPAESTDALFVDVDSIRKLPDGRIGFRWHAGGNGWQAANAAVSCGAPRWTPDIDNAPNQTSEIFSGGTNVFPMIKFVCGRMR